MFTKLKLALLVSAPLVAGATTYAAAQGGPRPRAELHQRYDKNGDGKLDDAERADLRKDRETRRAERRQQMLAKYDANRDGKLDDAERAIMRDARATERFQVLDKDGDGRLSLDEFKAGAQRHARHHRQGHGRTHGMKP